MQAQRVVVTGLGPVSPAASGREPFWRLFREHVEGQSGRPAVGGALQSDGPLGGTQRFRHLDTLGRLVLVTVAMALEDAGLDPAAGAGGDVGIALGTAYGCLAANVEYLHGIHARGQRFGNPVVFQNTVPNAAAGYASTAHGLRGPTATFSAGLTAGLEALDFAFRQVVEQRVSAMVAVSADQFFPQLVETFSRQGRISPAGIPRPLDLSRDGTVLSEGGCALVLEELGAARRRGARIYAELCGTGQSGGPGAAAGAVKLAVEQALAGAEAGSDDVGVVFCGASGARETDREESRGLHAALGARAAAAPSTCPKSLLGETLGSGGMFAAALAALSLHSGWVPPTAHYREADPECALNVQAGAARRWDPLTALVLGLGDEGGAHAALLRRCLE
jgi:3-oxoacyl-(acyl-carrier-protein) synthase